MSNTAIDNSLLAAAVDRLQPDALTSARQLALAEFKKYGLPDRRHEDWKYTSLASVVDVSNTWLGAGLAESDTDIPRGALEKDLLDSVDAHWITLVNGRIQMDDSFAALQSAGLSVSLLSDAGGSELQFADDPLSSLNAALLRDGLHIVVTSAAALDKPIGLLFSGTESTDTLGQERILLDVQANASLQLVECHLSEAKQARFNNVVMQIALGENSILDHVRLQQCHESHLLIGKTSTKMNSNANYRYATFDFGGRLVRNDIVADINAEGAQAELHGLYLAGESQHIDNHILVNHRVGPARSSEEYRGILNGNARAVFNGKAIVFEGADGTDANQSNHNLLLSEQAEIDTKPELEIYADDVKCSHGATVGQLDKAALFYLRSRGISHDDAAKLLTRAFAAGTVGDAPIESCRDFIGRLLDAKLTAMDIR